MPTDQSKLLHWYHPSPSCLLFMLLPVEVILFMLNWFHWFPKGCGVLIAIASVGITILFMLLWFALALLFRWRFQFTICSLLVLTIAVALPFSWLAVEMRQAKRQKETITTLGRLGFISYGNEKKPPECLLDMFGTDYFRDVTCIHINENLKHTDADLECLEHIEGMDHLRELNLFGGQFTDAGIEHLKGLKQLGSLVLFKTQITDAGLKHLEGLNQLKTLDLLQTKVTEAGVVKLQKALPNCQIEH